MRAEFDETLVTGNEMIDGQHKELIERINQLLESCEDGQGKVKAIKMLDYLLDYTEFHFSAEEKLQEEIQYPGIEEHKVKHAEFKNAVKELQEMLLSAELAEVFQERKTVLKKSSDAEFVAITKDRSEYSEEIISVILSEGDIAGGVIFLQKNEKKHFGEMEKKFAAGAADLLGRQLS